ncbi:MAG: thioredoxin family protein [Candidatus Bilamarchaeaceae archaeon]
MGILDEGTIKQVENELKDLKNDVKLIYFEKQNAPMNSHIKELLEAIAKTSKKISVEIHDIDKELEVAKTYGVNEAPVILIRGSFVKGDPRYYGIPSGYEFGAFIEVLKIAGGAAAINAEASAYFERKNDQTKIEVFVTPMCPHCPTSAYTAMKLAIGSSKVKGYVYEAMEFQELSRKYRVSGVPKTIINEGKGEYVGGYPEDVAFLQIKKILEGN